jgi:hypothetical protein
MLVPSKMFALKLFLKSLVEAFSLRHVKMLLSRKDSLFLKTKSYLFLAAKEFRSQ